ncbi:31852_t:CDS:2 [Gigaspora margarita]|uniref:31852_t:CDS:1 n=1 Tax=Gigaspora margarita TaxID=4874 RepID=A0ABN7V622_GIGMA|nr:31852_t:CDS:2 [Gigaspora margarita]
MEIMDDLFEARIKAREKIQGEKVLKYNAKLGSKIGGKLEEKWNGPYRIHEILGNGTYKLWTINQQEQVLIKVVYRTSALDGYGLIKYGKHRGGVVISEQSLRYKIKDGELNCSSKRKFNELTKDYNDYTRNNITILDLSECPGLIKLDCSSNVGLIVLNIRNCSSLVNINVVGCLGLRKVICDNTPHFPEKIIEQAKISFCLNQECREIYISKEYCNMHQKHCCKEEGCNLQIYISKEYCNMHVVKKKDVIHRSIFRKNIVICIRNTVVKKKDGETIVWQKVIKENLLKQLISSVKSELHSKSIFPAKQTKREEVYQNYLNRLLDAQKQSDQQVSLQILLGKKGEECLTKKLGDEKIKNICQTQMELTKLEKDLVKLEEEISLILN